MVLRRSHAVVLALSLLACDSATGTRATVAAPVELPVTPAPSGSTHAKPEGCGVLWRLSLTSGDDLDDARNVVGAITRGAVAAYEREVFGATSHQLCDSAPPFPRVVPRCREKVTVPVAFFGHGDETEGWGCLRFMVTRPVGWQFGYVKGGPYKGLGRGAPDLGPDGFQVYAERDADGDGKTALLIQSGTVNPETRSVRVATEIFAIDVDE